MADPGGKRFTLEQRQQLRYNPVSSSSSGVESSSIALSVIQQLRLIQESWVAARTAPVNQQLWKHFSKWTFDAKGSLQPDSCTAWAISSPWATQQKMSV
ncbi:unnamed protein product [Nezara viridula]|uniref:Uncharacterized protein n=1 Tax=Nezara viridula TaxID=85310 RepID=A0A9P0E879_NEZVI|nr:unnamed protein product [Nezara viridula]